MYATAAASHGHKTRFCPREQISTEIAAGWLWLLLPLPADIARPDVEAIAANLVKALIDGAPPGRIAVDVGKLQAEEFCMPVDIGAARTIAARLADLVRSL
jgi:hypothetical protein